MRSRTWGVGGGRDADDSAGGTGGGTQSEAGWRKLGGACEPALLQPRGRHVAAGCWRSAGRAACCCSLPPNQAVGTARLGGIKQTTRRPARCPPAAALGLGLLATQPPLAEKSRTTLRFRAATNCPTLPRSPPQQASARQQASCARRTLDQMPSAPTSRSPVKRRPSSAMAVTTCRAGSGPPANQKTDHRLAECSPAVDAALHVHPAASAAAARAAAVSAPTRLLAGGGVHRLLVVHNVYRVGDHALPRNLAARVRQNLLLSGSRKQAGGQG